MRSGAWASTTSMSIVSERPSALTCTRALEPTPRAGPESSQSRIRWSVNGSWLAMTSRNSKTRSRSCGTSTETVTGLGMYRMVHQTYQLVQSSPMAPEAPRDRLLERAIAVVSARGIADLSLRRLAEELGTSHRMLIHHFGSKEGLWVAIVREVERRQLAAVADLVPDEAASFAEASRAWWRHISDPSLWPNERLFFEVYGQALHGRRPAVDLLD